MWGIYAVYREIPTRGNIMYIKWGTWGLYYDDEIAWGVESDGENMYCNKSAVRRKIRLHRFYSKKNVVF